MRRGFNPVRRNRNIGTGKQGHGRDNRLSIPSICHCDRIWWEQLGTYSLQRRTLESRDLLFIVEETRCDCLHPCAVDDVCKMLAAIPARDWDGLNAFVFRQSTRKQWIVSPSWGRLAFSADIGRPGKPNVYSGPAVFLEAIDVFSQWAWDKSLTPSAVRELQRLKQDGHLICDSGNRFMITSNAESARTTQLYRTLLHEIGHWNDWRQRVLEPCGAGSDFDVLSNAYWARALREREAFANHYADTARRRLLAEGVIPFPRTSSPHTMQSKRLD